jgi:hypothetical protein
MLKFTGSGTEKKSPLKFTTYQPTQTEPYKIYTPETITPIAPTSTQKLGANFASNFIESGIGTSQMVKDTLNLMPEIKPNSMASKLGLTEQFKQKAIQGSDMKMAEMGIDKAKFNPILAQQTPAERVGFGVLSMAPQFASQVLFPAASIVKMGLTAGGSKSKEIQDAGGSLGAGVIGGAAKGISEIGMGAFSNQFLQGVLARKGAKELA